MKKLENKTVLITGGLSGIGKACAIAAATEGANVVVADIRSVNLDVAMKDIQGESDKSIFYECDIAKMDQVEQMIAHIVKTFGSLDVALNNAGIIADETSRIGEVEETSWHSVININLNGVFNCMKHELIQMSSQKQGSIINMSSVHGHVGFKNSSAYVAAKHGVIGLTQTAALEYAADQVRVNAICPGFIETPLLTKGGINEDQKSRQHILSLHPMGRFGKPEEVAKGFLFLACDDSSYITGSSLIMDGGFLSQ
jgi:NAD(P)-dependent dehydrogenase (short-subunit alcohol dehydrogenase family)